jgi:hypothetical protein
MPVLSILALATLTAALAADAPQASKMEPKIAKPGATLTVTGVSLAKPEVEEVYLTDHRFDMKVKVLEQTATGLKIRIPPFAKPGRLQLLLLTGGDSPKYLEQPVYVLVELEDKETEVTQAPAKESKDKETTVADNKGATNSPEKPR